MNPLFFIYLFLVIVSEYAGIWFCSKAVDNNIIYLLAGIFAYAIAAFFFYLTLTYYNNVAVVNSIWNVFSTVGAIGVGIILLKTKYNAVTNDWIYYYYYWFIIFNYILNDSY